MKRFLLALTAFLWAALLFANTPAGGVKGRVLSKTDRSPVEHARVRLTQGAALYGEARTDAKGNFHLVDVEDGDYTLVFHATGYLENRLPVTVAGGRIKNVFNVMLAELDKDADSWYSSPYGSTDIHRNMHHYLLINSAEGEPHLVDDDLMIAGVQMDGLSLPTVAPFGEALRENTYTSGAGLSETGFGGITGLAEIAGTASSFRSGFGGAITADDYRYLLRTDASYATGVTEKGWAVAADVSGRFWRMTNTQPYTAYVGVDKHFADKHQISSAFFMMGDPFSFLRYDYTPSAKFHAYVTALGQFSGNGGLHLAGAFTWHPSAKLTVAGGLDGSHALGQMNQEGRSLAWTNVFLALGKWGLHAGLKGGYWRTADGRGPIFSAKAGVSRTFTDHLRLYANGGYFLLTEGHRFASADMNVEYNANSINFKLTGYYENLLGTDGYHAGVDLGFKVPVLVIPNVSLQGGVTAGRYGRGTKVEPYQAYGGLSWNAHAWFVDAGYIYAPPYKMMDTSAGKTWSFENKRQLGVALGARPFFGVSAPAPRFSFRIFCRI